MCGGWTKLDVHVQTPTVSTSILLWHKNDDLLCIAVDDGTHQFVVEGVTSTVTDNAHVIPTRPTVYAPPMPGLEDDGSTWNLTILRHPLV